VFHGYRRGNVLLVKEYTARAPDLLATVALIVSWCVMCTWASSLTARSLARIAEQPFVLLVNIEGLHLIIRLAQLLVLAHEHDLRNPRKRERRNRECGRRAERNNVAGSVGLGPKVWGPDEGGV